MAPRGRGFRLKVTGLTELNAAMKAAPGRLDRKLGQANKRAVNEAIKPPVKRGAPRGATGNLARSVRGSASAKGAALLVGGGAKVPYAGVINWGWPAKNIRAQEFIYKGIMQGEEKMLEIYLTHIEEVAKLIAPQGKW